MVAICSGMHMILNYISFAPWTNGVLIFQLDHQETFILLTYIRKSTRSRVVLEVSIYILLLN